MMKFDSSWVIYYSNAIECKFVSFHFQSWCLWCQTYLAFTITSVTMLRSK